MGVRWAEERLVLFKGLDTVSLTMLQRVHGQHKLDLVFFSRLLLFCKEVTRMEGVGLGGLRSECDQGTLSGIPNDH